MGGGKHQPNLAPSALTSAGQGGNEATAINQRDPVNDTDGIIVGHSKTANGNVHAVFWLPAWDETYPQSGLFDLLDIGNGFRNSFAYAINEFGEVVGKSQVGSSSVYHAFRSDYEFDFTPRALGPANDMGTETAADGNTSEANDINNFGELVGASQFQGNLYHAAYKTPNSPKNIGWRRLRVLAEGTANAGTQSIALGIGNSGLIVGKSQIKVGNYMMWHGFIVTNDGEPGSQAIHDLNDMKDVNTPWVSVVINNVFVSAVSQGWVITSAEKINDANWIVGYGTKSGAVRAFVLSPR